MRPVKERHFKARGLKLVVHRNPVNARRLHGHGLDSLLLKPRAQSAQLGRDRAETAHWKSAQAANIFVAPKSSAAKPGRILSIISVE